MTAPRKTSFGISEISDINEIKIKVNNSTAGFFL